MNEADVSITVDGVYMFNVNVRLSIPFCIKNVEGSSMYEAAENAKNLLYKTLPILVAQNHQKIQEEMTLALENIEEVPDGKPGVSS